MNLDKLFRDIFGKGGTFEEAMKLVENAENTVHNHSVHVGGRVNSTIISNGGHSVSINGNQVVINGKSYTLPPYHSLSITNGKIILDGKAWAPEDGSPVAGVVELVVTGGDAGDIRTDYASITVNGNVRGSANAGGSITCGNVGGKVDAGGSVTCGDVGGDVDAGGSVRCGKVNGSVDAGGSVRHG